MRKHFARARTRAALLGALGLCASAALLGGAAVPVTLPAAARAIRADIECASVPAAVSKTHQINVVLDDSGSMFISPSPQRWSYVKYALMVFAAMLGPTDQMKVFLLSRRGQVTLTIQGSEGGPSQANVDAINGLKMQGGGTPWAAVPKARDDLARSDAESRWLVLMSDGQFDDHVATSAEFSNWASKYSKGDRSYDVGFLGAGRGAPSLAPAPGFYPANASDDLNEILGTTANLANQIFGRAELPAHAASGTAIQSDIALSSVLVLAQGDAAIGTPMGGEDQDQPFDLLAEPVNIPLPANPPASANGEKVKAVPAAGLTGQVATIPDLPHGTTRVDVGGASQTNFYYIPRVQFGVAWVHPATGQPVPPGEAVVAGTYQIQYGFMDADCRLIGPDRDELLGEVTLSATMSQDGGVTTTPLENGQSYDLTAGDVVVTVDGSYLGGAPAHAEIQQHVYPAPEIGVITIDDDELPVSAIGTGGSIGATYRGEGGRALTAQEWDAIEPAAFTARTEPDAGIVWTVEKGAQPGAIILTPAPTDGNVLHVDTSTPVELVVSVDYLFEEGIKRAEGSAGLTLVDDLSWWDRVLDWFATVGWVYLLVAAALVLIAGYVFKRRFSRRFKRTPTITARPQRRGRGAVGGQSRGEFKRSLVSWALPFVAERATLRYAPGNAGFTRLQLKAVARHGAGEITNWRALAAADRPDRSVEVSGTRLDKDLTRPPKVGPSTVILAQTPEMNYECQPNS